MHLILASPAFAAATDTSPVASAREIAANIDIPYERFTLANGLRVLVHTDRKAPVVAVSVWYDIGSKQEPKGKTGFAHLFEHLMFNGSENSDDDFFAPLKQMGATGYNGSTWFDRTNYYETVPTAALEKTLWLESDRMGHLLGAITQEKLDNQRAVVQNEKRQGDNQPYGLVQYYQAAALFPEGHPYGHSTIGSMADLNAASLADVHDWFRRNYGPNNAILVLAGDIDAKRAKPLVEKYFGKIARGPAAIKVEAPVTTLAARKDETIHDRIATTVIYRTWILPGLNDPSVVPLEIGASVLGGLASSRLDNLLVRDEKIAVSASASVMSFAQISQFEVSVSVKPGIDPALVSNRLDAIIADYVQTGPSRDEIARVATQSAASAVRSLESVGGKAMTLAEGLLYSNDPEKYAKDLVAYTSATPQTVRAALSKWLTRPVYALTVEAGARAPYAEADSANASNQAAAAPRVKTSKRDPAPEVGPVADLSFPNVTRSKLSNGIEVIYASRDAVPTTQISLSFDAGYAADPKAKLGTAGMVTALLSEGTSDLSSRQIAERQETLGSRIDAGSSMDRTSVKLTALSANLVPSLDLFADIALRPAFAPDEIERLRGQILAKIQSDLTTPGTIAGRILQPALYGPAHPYGVPSGSGDPAAVAKLTRDDLVAFHRAWFRPEKAKLFVVSDLPLARIVPLLETRFGRWAGNGPAGGKSFATPVPAAEPRILLVDRKDSPQSLILGGLVLDAKGSDRNLALEGAANIVGGDFLSRINMDLRETKGWSYGAGANITSVASRLSYRVSAPVQADKTGPALAAILAVYRAYLGDQGVTPAELERMQNGDIRKLPGAFETAAAVMQAMQTSDLLQRPDDHYARLPAEIRELSTGALDAAARRAIDPTKFIWVVVGDATKIRPQLDELGLPVEIVTAR
jgi:predicted Zn-dependent peptidase